MLLLDLRKTLTQRIFGPSDVNYDLNIDRILTAFLWPEWNLETSKQVCNYFFLYLRNGLLNFMDPNVDFALQEL